MFTFEVKSGKVIISDPCYDDEMVYPAKNDTWWADIERSDEGAWGNRVSELRAWASGSPVRYEYVQRGVDSGQMSIFDFAEFKNNSNYSKKDFPKRYFDEFSMYGDFDENDAWYSMCCAITCNTFENQKCQDFGEMKGGVVSSTGYGDGSYECKLGFDENGLLIFVKVTFIEEEDECWYCGCLETECECDDEEDICEECGEYETDCECQ